MLPRFAQFTPFPEPSPEFFSVLSPESLSDPMPDCFPGLSPDIFFEFFPSLRFFLFFLLSILFSGL